MVLSGNLYIETKMTWQIVVIIAQTQLYGMMITTKMKYIRFALAVYFSMIAACNRAK